MNSLHIKLLDDPNYRKSFEGLTVYGVAGTNGGGKDSLMNFLADNGFLVYNTSANLRRIAHAALKSIDRGGSDTPLGRVGNAQRRAYPGGSVDLGFLDWWTQADQLPADLRPRGLVIGSIRGTGEVARLKELGGKLIVVDADPHVRYERLQSRRRRDDVGLTFEEFQRQEDNEMAYGKTDPKDFGMAAVIEQADIYIDNSHENLESFEAEVRQILKL